LQHILRHDISFGKTIIFPKEKFIMKYVSKLTEAELTTLESAHKNHPISRVRMRAHVIILSFEGRQIKDITKICRISRFAVSRVINRWEENGFRGLFDNPRSGRTRSLTAEDEELIHKMVEEDPRSVKKIISTLEDQRGKKVSRSTVKRAIKKNAYGNVSESR
jgi:transposase